MRSRISNCRCRDRNAEATALNALVDGLTFELLTAPHLLSRTQAAVALRRALLPDAADGGRS